MHTSLRRLVFIGSTLLVASCGPTSPTGDDIEQSLQEALKSVQGSWRGTTLTGPVLNTVTLQFSLMEQPNGQLQGSGTMKELDAASTVPITVTGTFHRPVLNLMLNGMVYEGKAVTGSFRGDYLTVGGIADSLRLTAEGYEKAITILLQEQ